MQFKIALLIGILLFIFKELKSQCQNQYNYTNTITGTYTGSINSQTTTNYYIAPNATVTGNIDLNHGQILNCGTIINHKIKIKNVTNDIEGSIANSGIIITDTLIIDTLGDFHNFQSFTAKCIITKLKANIFNRATINTNTLILNDSSSLDNSQPFFKILTKTTKFNNSWVYNSGLIYAEDLFYNSLGSFINNFCTIQVDSLFRNYGGIGGGTNLPGGSSFGSILIENKSENYGQISNVEVCDHSTTNGGAFDINTGSTVGVTYCEKDPNCTTLNWVGIRETKLSTNSINISPNPFNDRITIHLLNNFNFSNSAIVILDNLGRKIHETKDLKEKQEIDLSSFPVGIYFLMVQSNSLQKVFKVIKE